MRQPGEVVDNAAEHRFEFEVDGALAIAEYAIHSGVVTFTHTFVPEPLRRQGIATRLVVAALDSARSRGLKVVPQCAVFAAYVDAHPAVQDLLVSRPSRPSP